MRVLLLVVMKYIFEKKALGGVLSIFVPQGCPGFLPAGYRFRLLFLGRGIKRRRYDMDCV